MSKSIAASLFLGLLATGNVSAQAPSRVLQDLQAYFQKTALPEGSFRPGIDPAYKGLADSAYSDLAPVTYAVVLHKTFGWKLPYPEATLAWLLSRQRRDGAFFNVGGTADPASAQARAYNTTQGLVGLHALGAKPKYDAKPVFEAVLKEDYRKLPLYMSSFFPLAYLSGGASMPPEADKKIHGLFVQAEDGYLNDHIAATFHLVHYCRLLDQPVPKAEAILTRVLHDQKEDGSWLLNPPSWDRHAGFDAVFTIRHLGGNRPDCRAAIAKAAKWALRCRNGDGGFGHYPGCASDTDAVYFQVGILVMAGYLRPVDLPPDISRLLSWGHVLPAKP